MQISPRDFLANVNATTFGKVITDRTLRRRRAELGGDPAKLDVGSYLSHLVERLQAKRARSEVATYDAKKEAARERSAEKSKSGRDIGALPPVVDPERKEACRLDLRLYLETYHADVFVDPWSDDHLEVIAAMQTAISTGGQFALAMPRGSGKTSLTECAALWAILYGHRRFVVTIGSDAEAAGQLLESIKSQCEHNDLLLEDFPEACAPIRALEGIVHRCKGQLYQGEPTAIEWKAKKIVFATIPGTACSGAIVVARGLTGRIRGLKHITAAGQSLRPDLAIPDDPQTDESANSIDQTNKRERIIFGAVMGLAGPGRSIAVIVPCTIIAHNDLAQRLLDRKRHPEFHGIRKQLMYAHPTNVGLWEKYFEILDEDLENDRGHDRATKFYQKNREAMDAGAMPAWPTRYKKHEGEISAIQHAMHLRHVNEFAYLAEYQNDPPDEMADDGELLGVDQIAAKVNGFKRGQIPPDTEYLVAGIDIQLRALYFVILALTEDFTASIVDYGAFPKQPTHYFTYATLPQPLDKMTVEGKVLRRRSPEARVRYALDAFVNEDLMQRRYERDDGAEMQICRALVDAGYMWDVVLRFMRESPERARLYPSKGRGVGASNQPISEAKKKPGERIGQEWIIPSTRGKRSVRHVIYDANHWKSFWVDRLATPLGEVGALTLYQAKPQRHRMLAENLAAEFRTRTEGRGRVVDEWKLRVGRDNHLLDCLVMAGVAGSIEGAALAERLERKKPKKKRGGRKLSEVRNKKRWG